MNGSIGQSVTIWHLKVIVYSNLHYNHFIDLVNGLIVRKILIFYI